jgi:hypothetical protein
MMSSIARTTGTINRQTAERLATTYGGQWRLERRPDGSTVAHLDTPARRAEGAR